MFLLNCSLLPLSKVACAFLGMALVIPSSPLAHAEEGQGDGAQTILLIGDSTVEERPDTAASQGWGKYLQQSLNAPWQVVNCASSGASTKTFLERKNWKQAQGVACRYLFIQFGHNDSHGPKRPESTDAATDFKQYLRDYVAYARGKKIEPVLITPMHRRTYHSDGRLKDSLAPYAQAVKEVATELNVPVIDLHTVSGERLKELGDAGSVDLFAENDRTHFSEKGAAWMASEVAAQAVKLDATLGEAFRKE